MITGKGCRGDGVDGENVLADDDGGGDDNEGMNGDDDDYDYNDDDDFFVVGDHHHHHHHHHHPINQNMKMLVQSCSKLRDHGDIRKDY